MFTRLTGLLIVPVWLLAMGWITAHDILPNWTAAAPPTIRAADFLAHRPQPSQYSIHDLSGPVGTIWTSYLIDEKSVRRDDLIWFDALPLDWGSMRLSASSTFDAEGALDELTFRLDSAQGNVELHGERFPSDFSFRLKSGPLDKVFKAPLTDGRLIAGAFHPFSELRNLKVGDRWRMQVVNPLSLVSGLGPQFLSVVVEVTGEDRIDTPSGPRNCLIVESQQARSWVDAEGLVQVQEINLPLAGQLRVIRQAGFDEVARTAVRQRSVSERGGKRR